MPPAHATRAALGFAAMLWGSLLAGCAGPPRMNKDAGATAPSPHIVWLFPGIEGGPIYLAGIERALRRGGVDATYRQFDWQRLLGLDNLTDLPGNVGRAEAVARDIAGELDSNPDAIVDVVGYSGGGGLALLAMRALPLRAHIRNLILIQPAISPDFDLTDVLTHIDGVLVNFYSPTDWLVLGLGTKALGTIDRKHVDSAGRYGFDLECAVPNASQRAKLFQQPWTDDMRQSGHGGGHASMVVGRWNTWFVAPWLRR